MSRPKPPRHFRSDRLVTGWSELVDLPEWRIRGLHAKVDTGAKNSALHATNVEPLPRGYVRFDVVATPSGRHRHVRARISRTGYVRSSSGHQERRYFVRTLVRLGPIEREVELSLVNRDQMQFRMLLGRTALTGLLVDPSSRRLLSKKAQTRGNTAG